MRTMRIGAVPVARVWSTDYAMVEGSVGLARIHVRRNLTAMGWAGDVEDMVLIVSELVSNAINHGRIVGETLTVRVAVLEEGGLLLDVSDRLAVFPHFDEVLACPPDDAEGGRGLLVIRAVGAQLEWFPCRGGGKTVRAHVVARRRD
ncbi:MULTISPECIES: ATP-binding protein [unclassified Streptomyces]|uniref:ATP-binding protein n=1 Tax=unclassified Streptomyces TaxID=2593676 RepID=UPI0037FCF13C